MHNFFNWLNHLADRFTDLTATFIGAIFASQISTEFVKIAFGAALSLAGKEGIYYIKKRIKRAKNKSN
jgi:uncharacterized membrane protein YfcA